MITVLFFLSFWAPGSLQLVLEIHQPGKGASSVSDMQRQIMEQDESLAIQAIVKRGIFWISLLPCFNIERNRNDILSYDSNATELSSVSLVIEGASQARGIREKIDLFLPWETWGRRKEGSQWNNLCVSQAFPSWLLQIGRE